MAQNSFTHGRKVAAALALLQSGQVETKQQAAAMVGISNSSLTPGKVGATLANNPEARAQLVTGLSILEISIDVERDGKSVQVTAREVFSTGAKQSIAILDEFGCKLRKLTKPQRTSVSDARNWLKMCKDFGLFRDDNTAPPAPGELTNALERPGTVEWYLRNHRRQDGERTAQALTLPGAPAAVEPADASESSPAE